MTLTQPKTKEEARQQAIEWQYKSSEYDLGYGDIIEAQIHFEKTGEQFDLTEEFKENGIV